MFYGLRIITIVAVTLAGFAFPAVGCRCAQAAAKVEQACPHCAVEQGAVEQGAAEQTAAPSQWQTPSCRCFDCGRNFTALRPTLTVSKRSNENLAGFIASERFKTAWSLADGSQNISQPHSPPGRLSCCSIPIFLGHLLF